ncbi:18119_t:CDS:2, partial [Funneliformis geosporum]
MNEEAFSIDVLHDEQKKSRKSSPHNCSPISMMKISPNGNYIVTYSKDDKTIVGWNVEDKNIIDGEHIEVNHVFHMCVSDERILAYINNKYEIIIFDMNNKQPQEVKLYFEFDAMEVRFCEFNEAKNKSTRPKKSECQTIYKIPKEAEIVSISKHNKIWLRLDHNLYEWNLRTGHTTIILKNIYEIKTKDIRISYNKELTCLKMNDDKIIIHSNKLGFSTTSIDLNNDKLLCDFMNHHHCLLLSLFDYPLIWNSKTKSHEVCFKKNNQLNKIELPSKFYDSESKNYRYVIVDGHVRRIEFNAELSNQQDGFLRKYKLDKGSIIWKIKIEGIQKFKIEENLNNKDIITDDSYMRMNKFKNYAESFIKYIKKIKLDNDLVKLKKFAKNFVDETWITETEEVYLNFIKWIINFEDKEIDHSKWKNKIGELMKGFIKRITKIEKLTKDSDKFTIKITENYLHINEDLIHLFGADRYLRDGDNKEGQNSLQDIKKFACKSLNDNNIIILTEIGIFVFKLNNSEKLISLNYFYHMYQPEQIIENISKMPGYPKDDKDSSGYDELINGWVSFVQVNNEEFLKYGSALLMFAIKVHDSDLIDDIYHKCLNLFNQENNKAFLSIFNASMPLLNKYYPEYIARYSSDTNMLIDSLEYKVEHLATFHLYPFSNIEIVDLTPSIFWTKYTIQVNDMRYYRDSNALSNWEYKNNPPLTILMVLFSLLIAVYLMNLLIGLLSNAIEEDNNRVSYYHADVDETRREINELIKDGEWNFDDFSGTKQNLLNKLRILNKQDIQKLDAIKKQLDEIQEAFSSK